MKKEAKRGNMTFEKVTASEKRLYGPRRLLLCGFAAAAQPKFNTLLKMIDLADVPVVWVTLDQAAMPISDLLELADDTGRGISSSLSRAIIVSGLTEKELHYLMSACRQTGMKAALWATVTPTSETWTLDQLLTELAAEREAMEKMKKGKTQ